MEIEKERKATSILNSCLFIKVHPGVPGCTLSPVLESQMIPISLQLTPHCSWASLNSFCSLQPEDPFLRTMMGPD